ATRSETAEQNSGRLNNIFDKERVQSEIDLQRKVSQEFSKNVQEARTEINRKAEGYKALAKAAEDKAAQALQNGDLNAYREAVQTANEHHQKADNWQKGGVALAAVATGLSAPTDSALGIAAATASPAAAYQIGQYFKELAQQNSDGKLTAKQETAHILAHAVLGAATAAAGDNNALAGTISAGSAEAAAPLIGNYLYGEKDGSKLTAEQKETVSSILNLGGAAVGATGSSTADAVAGGQAARTAVENNEFDLLQVISPSSAAYYSKDESHKNAMKLVSELRKFENSVIIVNGLPYVLGLGGSALIPLSGTGEALVLNEVGKKAILKAAGKGALVGGGVDILTQYGTCLYGQKENCSSSINYQRAAIAGGVSAATAGTGNYMAGSLAGVKQMGMLDVVKNSGSIKTFLKNNPTSSVIFVNEFTLNKLYSTTFKQIEEKSHKGVEK
ncbi:VENN motif pre-toxin domain-containing protein, partial [Neisseria yangbaofengii]